MQLSKFGTKFTRESGIHQLMTDLGDAYNSNHPDLCMLGGGNPAFIPEAQALFGHEMQKLIENKLFERMVGIYDGPQGEVSFRQVLAGYLREKFGWQISVITEYSVVALGLISQELAAVLLATGLSLT